MPEINTLLDTFREAMLSEQYAKAEAVTLDIADQLEASETERSELATSSIGRDLNPEATTVEASQTLHDHVGSGVVTQLVRTNVLTSLAAMVTDPESVSDQEVQTVVDRLKAEIETAEEELSDRRDAATRVRNDLDLPPRIRIERADLLTESLGLRTGETAELALTVANAGNAAAEAVTILGELSSGVTSDPIDESVDRIAGGERIDRIYEIELAPDGADLEVVRISIESANAGEDVARVRIPRVDVRSIHDYATDNGIIDTNGLRDAVADWRTGEIDTALLREVVEYWRSGESVT